MKKVNIFLVCAAMILVGMLFQSCGGGASSNSKISNMLIVLDEGYKDIWGISYHLKLKNVTNKTLDGRFDVKVIRKDGTSYTWQCYANNMEPGDIRWFTIHSDLYTKFNVSSWSFVDK